MKMANWVKMLRGDMSGLKNKVKKEKLISENKVYRLSWADNNQTTNLINHNEAVRLINEWINRTGWNWIKVINIDNHEQQIIYEPPSKNNRGFLHLSQLNENMITLEDK